MKNIKVLFISTLYIFIFSSCSTTVKTTETTIYIDDGNDEVENKILISLTAGNSYNHPTYVIWTEDMMGNYIKTIFITASYASGIYGHGMTSDSAWSDVPGSSYQPAALPYWTFKKGLLNNGNLVPNVENPFVDAYTGATPKANFRFETSNENNASNYRILLEVNQTADWNAYWTNNKYPGNYAYKNSAQPSLIYAVTINQADSVFYLNPIGHGNPKGENGKLFTQLNTLTTATDIYKSVKVELVQ